MCNAYPHRDAECILHFDKHTHTHTHRDNPEGRARIIEEELEKERLREAARREEQEEGGGPGEYACDSVIDAVHADAGVWRKSPEWTQVCMEERETVERQ